MYKSAIRTNPAFLKRPNKQVSYSFRVLSPKREPANSKGLNAFNSFGVRGQRWLTEHYIKHRKELFSSNIHHLPTQLQRKWIIRSSKPLTDGINRINAVTIVRSARLFSGKSDEKENKDKKKTTSLGLGRNKDGDDNGCTLGKPGKKSLEASTISESCQTEVVHDQSSQVDNSERQQHSQTRHPDSEEKKKESKSSIVKRYIKKWPERKKVPADTGSSKKLEDFDRLQLLKGKLISKLGKQWLSWENITDTFDKFPYYISENTRDLLLECAAARLKKHELSKFGESLPSSSHLILLQGQPGTELYQEVLVRAVAQHLQVSLLVLDSNTLTAKDLKDDVHIAGSSINEHDDDDYKVTSNDNSHAENSGNAEVLSLKSLDSLKQVFGCPVKIIDFKNLGAKFGLPWKVHHVPDKKENKKKISKLVEPDNNYWADELKKLVVTVREDELKKLGKKGEELKKFWHDLIIGDRVRYKGPKASRAKTRTKVSIGQEGFVSSISDGLPWKVCVKFQGKHGTSDADEVFCDAAELEKVDSSASDEAWLARFPELPIEALCKMVLYRGRVIVYFPDFQQWFASAPPSKGRGLLLKKVKDLLSKVNSPVVFIASRIKEDSSTPAAVSLGLESILPPSMFFEASKPSPTASEGEEDSDRVFKIFKNVIRVFPPEEPQLLHTWQKHLEEDKKSAKKRRNHMLLEESLQQHGMSCVELANINTLDLHLTSESAEDVIGWARNMSLHSNQIQISEGKLLLEKKCLEKSLMRLKALKASSEEKISHIMELTENEYEKSFFSSVVLAHDIGVKFDEIGALDNVKSTLKDLIVLPLQRPELFTRGNLRKPCKGVLLFGPPGTGKTLMAKAVATEAGANFINVSASSITSKFYGDDEKLVKGLFTLARKLSPVVIFIDEVDSLLGARGHSSEHEATRRIKNEFMASWDGLQSKENEQILVFATTNRPFDLDDAVIRRLPRRLLIDLPNVENRARILRIILANEDLDDTFNYDTLAAQTEGYSGSDLKNLCVAAAYTPIREFLAAEQQVKGSSEGENSLSQTAMVVRPLCLEDFIQAKSKVGVSVAYDAASMIQMRQWNEQYGEGGSRSQIVFGFSQ